MIYLEKYECLFLWKTSLSIDLREYLFWRRKIFADVIHGKVDVISINRCPKRQKKDR